MRITWLGHAAFLTENPTTEVSPEDVDCDTIVRILKVGETAELDSGSTR